MTLDFRYNVNTYFLLNRGLNDIILKRNVHRLHRVSRLQWAMNGYSMNYIGQCWIVVWYKYQVNVIANLLQNTSENLVYQYNIAFCAPWIANMDLRHVQQRKRARERCQNSLYLQRKFWWSLSLLNTPPIFFCRATSAVV